MYFFVLFEWVINICVELTLYKSWSVCVFRTFPNELHLWLVTVLAPHSDDYTVRSEVGQWTHNNEERRAWFCLKAASAGVLKLHPMPLLNMWWIWSDMRCLSSSGCCFSTVPNNSMMRVSAVRCGGFSSWRTAPRWAYIIYCWCVNVQRSSRARISAVVASSSYALLLKNKLFTSVLITRQSVTVCNLRYTLLNYQLLHGTICIQFHYNSQ